jgi:DNA-binding NtrC family response regulator
MASARADHSERLLRGKVLIVEDHEGVRELFRAVLEEQYCIREAASGAALLDALEQEQPDVVLLDLRLPDADGLGLLPAINQRWPETQVIILTGAAHDSEAMSAAVEAVNRGAFSLFSKSADLNLQQLLAGVSSALERRLQIPGDQPPRPMI